MRRDVGLVITGVLVAVLAAWVLEAAPDLSTAHGLLNGGAREVNLFLSAHLVMFTVVGSVLALLVVGVAVLIWRRFEGDVVPAQLTQVGVGVLLLVLAMWCATGCSRILGALLFLGGVFLVVASIARIRRYLHAGVDLY